MHLKYWVNFWGEYVKSITVRPLFLWSWFESIWHYYPQICVVLAANFWTASVRCMWLVWKKDRKQRSTNSMNLNKSEKPLRIIPFFFMGDYFSLLGRLVSTIHAGEEVQLCRSSNFLVLSSGTEKEGFYTLCSARSMDFLCISKCRSTKKTQPSRI